MSASKQVWAGRVVSGLVCAPFAAASVMKLARLAMMASGFAQMGLPESLIRVVGTLELASVVLYLIPRTAVLGAIVFTGFIGGAILTHLRLGQPVYVQTALGVLVWLGLWLREARLRELIPLRRP